MNQNQLGEMIDMMVATLGDMDRLVRDAQHTQKSITEMLKLLSRQQADSLTAEQFATYEMFLKNKPDS
jgi:hypothetical protein